MKEQELRQREAALASREGELRRAAALDTRALQLEEERLRGVEAVLVGRLREADAALDALEAAHRGIGEQNTKLGGVCVCWSVLLFILRHTQTLCFIASHHTLKSA